MSKSVPEATKKGENCIFNEGKDHKECTGNYGQGEDVFRNTYSVLIPLPLLAV